MIEIARITPSSIELKGVKFSDGETAQKIMDICHKFKHLYMEGYPCGRKTRKNAKKRYKKWVDCPEICFTYLVTNDNASHNLAIHVLVSDIQSLLKRYTEKEIEYYIQMFTQDIADEVITLEF